MGRSSVVEKRVKMRYPKRVEIKVGIISGDKGYEDGLTVGEIAEKHEFGLGVPERSWLRGWFDGHADDVKDIARDYLEDAARGNRTFVSVGNLIAGVASASCRKRIEAAEELLPITSPMTIALKKAKGLNPPYTPLVETGVLLGSIAGDAEVTP